MKDFLNNDWWGLLKEEFNKPYYQELRTKLIEEYKKDIVYPTPNLIYNALRLTPYNKIKAVILGQDPYHQRGQAMGLSFSVPEGIKKPPSLINIFKELEDDLGIRANSSDLTPWAKEGVLLLNSYLTVCEGRPLSHKDIGWERLTDRIIELVSMKGGVVFILWGNYAKGKIPLIKEGNYILTSVHPSPLSAHRGFFGKKPFSRANLYLESQGIEPIDWRV